jgi:hypothetical protein
VPSRVVAGIIEDLHDYGRTPAICASRSTHMEDIGAPRPLCANKSERLEVKNLARILRSNSRDAKQTGLKYGPLIWKRSCPRLLNGGMGAPVRSFTC